MLAADAWQAAPGTAGVVVLHGFASNRANHRDFAERVHTAGLSALALDLRGHGESAGNPDGGTIDDVTAAVDWLAARGASAIGVRGSSLGGFLALHAAQRDERIGAVVAICPAHQDGLSNRRGLTWARSMPLEDAVARPGVARGFWHARDDELVPWQWSWHLAQRAPHPRHLRIVMGGHHGSLQHDPAVEADFIAFLAAHLTG